MTDPNGTKVRRRAPERLRDEIANLSIPDMRILCDLLVEMEDPLAEFFWKSMQAAVRRREQPTSGGAAK